MHNIYKLIFIVTNTENHLQTTNHLFYHNYLAVCQAQPHKQATQPLDWEYDGMLQGRRKHQIIGPTPINYSWDVFRIRFNWVFELWTGKLHTVQYCK